MSNLPVLDYFPGYSGRMTKLAVSWLKGMGWVYVSIAFLVLAVIVLSGDLPKGMWDLFGVILVMLLMVGIASIFFVSARWLGSGERRGFVVPLWIILVHVLAVGAMISRIAWITFGGVVDPRVPIFGLMAIIFYAGFVFLFLGPLTYYLVRAGWEIKRAGRTL
jgi:hypothetical protein